MANKKNIDVRDQVTLSFEKSFRFCRKGISYRLFRSSLTLAVVVVAVAFFTVLLSEGLIVRATSHGVNDEMQSQREADTLLMHLFHRYSSRDLSAKLADMRNQPERIAEFARVTGLSDKAVTDLVEQCYVEQRFLRFFQNLSPGKRVVLVKKLEGREVFPYLAEREVWNTFETDLANMRSVRLPLGVQNLRSFVDNYGDFLAALEAARLARNRTVTAMESELAGLTGGQPTAAWLGQAADPEVEQWRSVVAEHGFALDKETMTRVHRRLQLATLEDRIATLLQTPAKRAEWKRIMQGTAGLEEKLLMLEDERLTDILGDAFTMEERQAVASRFARLKTLRDLESRLPPADRQARGIGRFLDGRQLFLVAISFLVCMVGITNAMLMSITERFREIATMKCLGATDGFILKQFLIEAAIQGVIGGSAGMLIGMLISVIKSLVLFGGIVFMHFPTLQILVCAGVTVVVGIVLAMLASIYPARAAARMAPMDAMRVE